mmetsp:Transcript_90974/g.175121  ORF Transcript_90974/g.175121 Transcript_90974/m.175121 type:complete len:830 (+) Transcript_90974:93-2582(+)
MSGLKHRMQQGRRSSFNYSPDQTDVVTGGKMSVEERTFLLDVLRENPHLQRLVRLDEEHLELFAKSASRQTYAAGEVLMTEGSLTNSTFYIVDSGMMEISGYTPFLIVEHNPCTKYLCRPLELVSPEDTSERTVFSVGRGLCIGDMSMAFNQPRLATAVATQPSVVWVFGQAAFKIVQNKALLSLMGDSSVQDHNPSGQRFSVGSKSFLDEQVIAEALAKNANLQMLVPLSSEHIKQLVNIATRQELAEGKILMYEGDLNAEAFYIVGEGTLEATGTEPFEVVTVGNSSYFHNAAHTGECVETGSTTKTVCQVGRGHVFGEISMLHCAPRFATLKAMEHTILWVVDRANFQMVQMRAAEDQVKKRVRYLEECSEITSSLPNGFTEALAGIMDAMRLQSGEVLLTEGELGIAFYILYEGEVLVSSSSKAERTLTANPSAGTHHFFGESALRQTDMHHTATVKVTSPTATVLVLMQRDYMLLWDQLIENATAPKFERLATVHSPSRLYGGLQLSRLKKTGLIGWGCFGPVELLEDERTKESYAFKVVGKDGILKRGMTQTMLREKTTWQMPSSLFIIKLVACFNEPAYLGFLLEYASGGDLLTLYQRSGLHGDAGAARFYVAGVVLALTCLHRMKVIHRNIRPENVLISATGQPKVTDMSLAKLVIGQTFTMCGAPQYIAPEVLAGTGHHRAVDWWCLGVMIFELMAGRTPFDADHPMRIYWKVMRGIVCVQMPEVCEGITGELIRSLLSPQAIDRLPMRKGDLQNVLDHPWYTDFNWPAMKQRELPPPWVPKLSDSTDISHFNPCPQDLLQQEPFNTGAEDYDWALEFGS